MSEKKWLNHNGRRVKAGSGGSGGSCTYTSSSPSNVEVGGIPSGTSFNNTPCEDVLEQLLHKYLLPAFSDFKLDRPSVVEVGSDLSGSGNATWSTTNSGNVQPNTVDIDDITGGTNLVSNTADDGSEAVTLTSVVHNTQATHTFRISAQNTKGDTFTRDYNIHWYFRVFYGNESTTPLDENGIEGLSDNLLTNTFARTYHYASGGGYKYVCYPTSFGTASTFTDVDTGFAVAMESPYVVSVTNGLGITQDYNVHRTTNVINGELNMSVS